MHSYNGRTGSDAILGLLALASPNAKKAQGLPQGVSVTSIDAAFLLPQGSVYIWSVAKQWSQVEWHFNVSIQKPYWIWHSPNAPFHIEETLCNNLFHRPRHLRGLSVSSHNGTRVQTTNFTRTAWGYIPSTYLIWERRKGDQLREAENMLDILGLKGSRLNNAVNSTKSLRKWIGDGGTICCTAKRGEKTRRTDW